MVIIVQNGDGAGDNDCGTLNPALVKHLGKGFVKLQTIMAQQLI